MKQAFAAAAAILSLAAVPALAQTSDAPSVGATTGVAAPMPTPPTQSADNPHTVNPMPEPGSVPPPAAGAPTSEAPTSAPASDLGAQTGAPGDTNSALRKAYPVCKSPNQDSCRVSRRTPAEAR